ncbi:MAG: tetratricopeptide repeat protein [Thermoguttaceae bacterium]|nr:tetratricopeptide repeat protein [Thermoguttaceae bacterium]
MATEPLPLDVRQLVLYSGSFGPREIDELRKEISRDPKKFDELKGAVNELKTKDEEELSPAVRVKLGVCQFVIGAYDDSFASLKKGDGGALAQFYFAKLFAVKGDLEASIAAYNTAQSAGYNVDDCALGRAEVYRDMGKLQQSLQELDYLSGAVEQTAEYLYQRAATVNALGVNPIEAIALYERAVQADPNHPGALYGLAMENERRGNDEEALKLYQRAAGRFPTNVGVLMNLGVLYEDMERYEEAVACYKRVLDAYPMDERAALYLKDAKAAVEIVKAPVVSGPTETTKMRNLQKKISEIELSQRSRNCLAAMGVETLGDLCSHTEQDLLRMPNFGDTSLNEIKQHLATFDLKLGMQTAGAPAAVSPVADEDVPPEMRRLLALPVGDLELSVRARKCMTRLGIKSIGELIKKTADELLSCKNFGVTSLNEINEKLASKGLKLRGE